MYFYIILKIEKHVPFSGVGLFTLVRNYVSQSMPDKFLKLYFLKLTFCFKMIQTLNYAIS